MIEETKNPETLESDNEPIVSETIVSNSPVDEIESAFEAFNQTNSEFKAEEQQVPDPSDPTEIDLSDAENFKLQIFISLMFTLLDGLHVFIYGFMSKYKITRDDIGLDENDKQGLEIYFRTQRVMDLINRLPVEVIGFLHIEYMYFNKFREFNKRMKDENTEEPGEEEEFFEEELEEEEPRTTEQKIERLLSEKRKEFDKKKIVQYPADIGTNNDTTKKATPKKTAKKATPKKRATKKAEVKKVAPKKEVPKNKPEE